MTLHQGEPVTETVTPLVTECKHEIGHIVITCGKALAYLYGSKMGLYAVHGYCPECGKAVHWTNRDVVFNRMMKRIKREEA